MDPELTILRESMQVTSSQRKEASLTREPRMEDLILPRPAAQCAKFHICDAALRLATRLHVGLREQQRVILITGVDQADASSWLSAQLALAMIRIKQTPALLVDCNMRAPQVHTRFETAQGPGLHDLIAASFELTEVIRSSDVPDFFVLPVGSLPSTTPILSPPDCAQALETFRERFRYTFLDAGPVLQSPEAMLLVSLSDGVVVSVAAKARRRSEVLRVKQELAALKANVLGVVLIEEIKR